MSSRLLSFLSRSLLLRLATYSSIAIGATSVQLDDPLFHQQWSLANDGTQTVSIDIDDLHTLAQPGVKNVDIGYLSTRAEVAAAAKAPVTVAVIDYGVDPTHPDLQGRIAPGGWNFTTNSDNMFDEEGHGTHVTGIIAANAGNHIGIAGIAPPSVKVLPLKVLTNGYENFMYGGKFISDYVADAVRYATAHGAGVINMSLGWPKLIDTENARQAVSEAVAKGVIVVVSAGNDRKDKPSYPCAYEGVICVGAISNNGAPTLFTNSGGAVDILAPGDGIVSTIPLTVESETLRIQGYELMSGTSQSSPEVAAMAAILKSINPNITADEVKARLFASGKSSMKAGSSLYGLANIPGAIHAAAQAVYVPDFKVLESVIINESNLTVNDQLSIRNLWKTATNVTAKLTINGVLAGQANLAQFAASQTLVIPWQYKFASLDEAAQLNLNLTISDDSGKTTEFASSLMAARAMDQIKTQNPVAFPSTTAMARDWIGINIDGHPYAKLAAVTTLGATSGYPIYYRLAGQDAKGLTIALFNTADNGSSAAIQIPSISKVMQVMRLNIQGDKQLDWVITGFGKDKQNHTFLQFYFLGPDLKPLWNHGSAWQIEPADATQVKNMLRDYSKPNSWVRGSNGHLEPCFFANGPLSAPDDFDSLDSRHQQSGSHLFYIAPIAGQKPSGLVQQAELRAVDTAALYANHTLGRLVNPLPQSPAEAAAGQLGLIFAEGEQLASKVSILAVQATNKISLHAKSGWDISLAAGLSVPAVTPVSAQNEAVLLSFTDSSRGSLTWTNANGQMETLTPFAFKAPLDPVEGLIGAHDINGQGRYWFIETRFNLLAYHQSNAASKIEMQQIPIERDSSFPGEEFDELMQPVLVGTAEKPVAGVFVDSTLVRGQLLSIITWNPETARLEKPLRDSMSVPAKCLQLSPVHLTNAPESIAVPLACDDGTGRAVLHLVQPNN